MNSKLLVKRLEGVIAKRSRRDTNALEVREIVGRAVAQIRDRFPPRDLTRLCRVLGVEDVAHVALATKGRLLAASGGFRIEINESLDEFECRFTLAHELGHVLLEQRRLSTTTPGMESISAPDHKSIRMIEQLCDEAANEILVPRDWLAQSAGETASLQTAVDVARSTETSLDFVLSRLVEEGLWRCRLLGWKIVGDCYYAETCIPSREEASLIMIDPIPRDQSVFDESLEVGAISSGVLRMSVGHEREEYAAEFLRLSETRIVTLMRLGRTAAHPHARRPIRRDDVTYVEPDDPDQT